MQRIKTLRIYPQKKIKRYKEQCPNKVAAYLEEIRNISKSRIAYVDETGIDTFLHREYCYAKKGETVKGYISGKKYRRVGIVAAKMENQILAPLQYNGTMDSQLFEVWFETMLMCELPTNSVIIMDNAAFHRKKQLISIAQNYHHEIIFLPPYSPNLNPIEKFWALLKSKLRKYLPQFLTFDNALHYCFT